VTVNLVDTTDEATFTTQVIELARMLRYRVAHFRPAMTKHGWRTAVAGDGAGFCDLVMVKPGRLIFAELKSETGRLTEEQTHWIATLREAGAEVWVWRPSDFDQIVAVLRKRGPVG
jgi:hypothetical protein